MLIIKSKSRKNYQFKIVIYILIFFLLISCKQNRNNSTQIVSTTVSDVKIDYLPTSTTNQIIQHENYTLSYSEKYEQAEWVAYKLTNDEVSHSGNFKRPYFIDDPKVKTGSAKWYNYKKSGYDKGHLCPAGDRSFSEQAYDETFYTSNISPQNHQFNSGIWNRLEQKTRYWATKYNTVYVISGGVLTDNLKAIGEEHVSVPKFFYKIIYSNYEGKDRMIAFLIPNEPSNQPLYEFVVTTDRIEQITGIDFFPKLDDKIENELESTNNYKTWSF